MRLSKNGRGVVQNPSDREVSRTDERSTHLQRSRSRRKSSETNVVASLMSLTTCVWSMTLYCRNEMSVLRWFVRSLPPTSILALSVLVSRQMKLSLPQRRIHRPFNSRLDHLALHEWNYVGVRVTSIHDDRAFWVDRESSRLLPSGEEKSWIIGKQRGRFKKAAQQSGSNQLRWRGKDE